MRKRTEARECALKVLYQFDILKTDTEELLKDFWANYEQEPEQEIVEFSASLINGVKEKLDEIDKIIAERATNWHINRMAVIDRNVLRLGAYELLFRQDIPPKVAINESVELAKKYGDTDSGKFVNGILDRIHKDRHPEK